MVWYLQHQHGFLSKRSTCTQLLDSFQDWVVGLSNRKAVDVVYIDFSKAFDSVVYSKLLIKLSSYGIKYELLAWLNSFLVGRCQCVSIDGFFSELSTVVSGVPQGTVLYPYSCLFCISMMLLISLISLQLVNFSLMMSNYIATYRQISLTCACSKIMESIINENMLVYLLDNGDLICWRK